MAVSPVPPADAILVRRRLGTLSPIVCASPLYLQKHPVPQSPADLARHNCLRHPYAPPSPDEWLFQDPVGNPVLARGSGSLITDSTETRRAAAAAGVGSAGAGTLRLPGAGLRDHNAFYPSRRHLSAKVRVFIDMLVDRRARAFFGAGRGLGNPDKLKHSPEAQLRRRAASQRGVFYVCVPLSQSRPT